MSKKPFSITNYLPAFVLIGTAFLSVSTSVQAAFTDLSFNYTSGRSSFLGALAPGNTTDSSLITIQTSPAPGVYSLSSEQLVPSDLLQIGDHHYYVATNSAITVPSEVPLDRPLDPADTTAATQILMRQQNTVSFSFTTSQAVPDGLLQVLVPAATPSAFAADNLPDPDGFDFATSYLTCPDSIPGVFDFSTPTATPASTATIPINGRPYHTYNCAYTGTGDANTSFTSASPITVHDLLNPAPSTSHQSGTVDISQILLRQIGADQVTRESVTGQLGFFEPVKIIVEVAPQLSFQINGLPAQTNACGVATDVATAARDVPFEDISPTYFKNAAQRLTISTNAAHGYTVTAIADDQMGINASPCNIFTFVSVRAVNVI